MLSLSEVICVRLIGAICFIIGAILMLNTASNSPFWGVASTTTLNGFGFTTHLLAAIVLMVVGGIVLHKTN